METLLAGLVLAVNAFTEAFKAFLATLPFTLTEDQNKLVVRVFALVVGIAAAFLADFNLVGYYLPAVPISHQIAVLLSGLALAVPSDFLQAALEFLKAARDKKTAEAEATHRVAG